jgi:ABC-type transport system involved in multi-copper enzyme maturation permease subunit
MLNEPDIHREVHPRELHHTHIPFKRISWSAIFIGALVALGLSFLLNLFGLAIGLSAFNLNNTGQEAVAIGGLLAMFVGIIATMLAAGYTAGYLGRLFCPQRNLGILYGFSTWTLSLILGAIITLPLANFAHHSAYGTSPAISLESTNSTATNNQVSVQTKSTPTAQNPDQQTVNVKAPASTLAWSGFCIFLLFFLGALFCCIGAHWGMHCERDD